jgi:hypothetical protein
MGGSDLGVAGSIPAPATTEIKLLIQPKRDHECGAVNGTARSVKPLTPFLHRRCSILTSLVDRLIGDFKSDKAQCRPDKTNLECGKCFEIEKRRLNNLSLDPVLMVAEQEYLPKLLMRRKQ